MDIQWYPGHMTKAKRQMQEDLKLINLIIEIIDARVPYSGRNPDIAAMGNGKARLIVLNKADLADERANAVWESFYRERGAEVLLTDARDRGSLKKVKPFILSACREIIERNEKRGIRNRPIRAMVAGIPNSGKSTFINSVAGRASAKTGNRPGVTKGKQWIHLDRQLDLLDTPGILWPKIDDPKAALRLAMIGSVSDNVVQSEELSLEMIRFLKDRYPGTLAGRYQVQEDAEPVRILEEIAKNRNCIAKGNSIAYDRAAAILIDEFRSGKLGKFTLEMPEDIT